MRRQSVSKFLPYLFILFCTVYTNYRWTRTEEAIYQALRDVQQKDIFIIDAEGSNVDNGLTPALNKNDEDEKGPPALMVGSFDGISKSPNSLHTLRRKHNYETGIALEKKLVDPQSTLDLLHFAVIGFEVDWWKGKIDLSLFHSRRGEIDHVTNKIPKLVEPGKEYMKQIVNRTKEGFNVKSKKKRGFAIYHEALTTSTFLARLETFFPSTKLIYIVKHPIEYIKDYIDMIQLSTSKSKSELISFDNMQELLMMKCGVGYNRGMDESYRDYRSICTNTAKFHVHLSRLGHTPLDSEKELNLLGDLDDDYSVHDLSTSQVFIFDSAQLQDGNEDRSKQLFQDMQKFIEINRPIKLKTSNPFEKKKYRSTFRMYYRPKNEERQIDICDAKYDAVRRELIKIGSDASTWIRDYFIQSPNVIVPNREHFLKSMERWKVDPCNVNELDVFDPEYTSSLFQWGVVGMQKCGTTFIYENFLKSPEIPTPTRENHNLHHEGKKMLQMYLDHVNPAYIGAGEKRGFSTPDALTHRLSLERMEKYTPDLKMIFSLKHPVRWFMSWYNYVAATNQLAMKERWFMKRPNEYIGNCGFDCETDCVAGKEAYNLVCTGFARVHVHLSRLGWTPLNTERELALLGNPKETIENYSVHNFTNQRLILIEEGQMRDNNDTRSERLERAMEEHIGVKSNTLSLRTEVRVNTIDSQHTKYSPISDPIEICDGEHDLVRKVLLEIGKNASEWIKEFFLESPKVVVANKDDFLKRIDQWGVDPCENL